MTYVFGEPVSGPDYMTANGTLRRATFFLGAEWDLQDGNWMWLSRDLVADFELAFPGQTWVKAYGVRLQGGYKGYNGASGEETQLLADDISFSAWNRGVVRHGAAEWTEGANYWTSNGPQELDVAVYNHYDHLGNLAIRSDSAGELTSTWDYDAYGNYYGGSGDASIENYRHTGNHYDADVGLFYFNNRWYDADIGRFTQRHTPYQPLLEHPYAISENNPSSWPDPSGLCPDVGEAIYYGLFGTEHDPTFSEALINNSIGGEITKLEGIYDADYTAERYTVTGALVVSGASTLGASTIIASEAIDAAGYHTVGRVITQRSIVHAKLGYKFPGARHYSEMLTRHLLMGGGKRLPGRTWRTFLYRANDGKAEMAYDWVSGKVIHQICKISK